jgi:hypothetical protein
MAARKTGRERRRYFSVRGGAPTDGGLDLAAVKRVVGDAFERLERDGFFQQAFGALHSQKGQIPGYVREDPILYVQRKVRKKGLWPIAERIHSYDKNDLFDVIEFLYDHVSKGVKGMTVPSESGLFKQYWTFDKRAGRREFKEIMNDILADYGRGYQLTADGEIFALPQDGMDSLMEMDVDHPDEMNVVHRVNAARQKYSRHGSTTDDRRDAVRSLVDVMEYMRPKIKEVLVEKDEADLFTIANNFGIRHHRQRQQMLYDQDIWLDWMFYHYLATIHACVRLLAKQGK